MVVFVKDSDTLKKEMLEIRRVQNDCRARGKSCFIAFDTEQEQIRFQPNRVCVMQFSIKLSRFIIKTIVVSTDFCVLPTPKHAAKKGVIFLCGEFLDVMEDDNTCWVGAALKGDFDLVNKQFFLLPAYIRYIDVAKVFKIMLFLEGKDCLPLIGPLCSSCK